MPARICDDAARFLLSVLSILGQVYQKVQQFSVSSVVLLPLLRLHPSLLVLLLLLRLL